MLKQKAKSLQSASFPRRLLRAMQQKLINALDRYELMLRDNFYTAKSLLRWRREESLIIQSSVKLYCRQQLREKMGVGRDTPLTLEMPLSGGRSLVWIAKAAEKRMLVRAYPLALQLKAERHRDAAELLVSNGINVPRILEYRHEPKRYSAIIMAEEFIEGKSLPDSELTPVHVQTIAQLFSRLHSVKKNKWGRLGFERSERLASFTMRHIKRDLLEVRRGSDLLHDKGLEQSLRDWFAQWENDLDSITEFSLVHNDVHPTNGIFTDPTTYHLIDFTAVSWYPASKELPCIYRRLLGGTESNISIFEEHYFSNKPPQEYDFFKRLRPFYEAHFLLNQVVTKQSRAASTPARQKELGVRRDFAWQELLKVVDTNKSA